MTMERPAVYATLGHPLIAMFPEKMESHLIEADQFYQIFYQMPFNGGNSHKQA
ncbi:MAG: hypothetical protein QM498_14400 [Desulfobacterium sp.]